jgi:hypothetical protein
VPGRKRGLAVDALGLIVAVVVMMAASATDNAVGERLLDTVEQDSSPRANPKTAKSLRTTLSEPEVAQDSEDAAVVAF